MAERKTGPVKPPTIELTAREAGADGEARKDAPRTPAAEPVGPADPAEDVVSAADAEGVPPPQPIPPAPPRPEPPRAPRQSVVALGASPPWGMLATAAVAGALLGTGLTYVLATMVPLPAPPMPNLAPQIREQGDRLSTVEQRLTAAETGTMDVKASADATSSELVARLTALEGGLAELRAATPAQVDTSAIEGRLRTLTSRVDAIGAGASSADAGAMAENIEDLEASVAALQTELDALKTRTADTSALSALEADVASLKTQMEEAAAEPEPPPAAALQVIVPGLETAFATGRPFATELASLANEQPPVAIDAALSVRAGVGLVRPDVLDQQFVAAVPAMLEAKPAAAGGDWQQSAGDWVASLLAIRPAGEIEGDSPEAVISRLEGAMTRHDYAAASALFDALPPEMVAAAGTVPADIRSHAAAAKLVADLRARMNPS
jgi:hypothetical protein